MVAQHKNRQNLTYNKDLNTTQTEEIIIPALQRESQSQNATA